MSEVSHLVVQSKGTTKGSIQTIFNDGADSITDPKIIANNFNNFFLNIGPTLASKLSSNCSFNKYLDPSMRITNSMFLCPVDEGEILKVSYSCLKPNKAACCKQL